MCDLGAPYIYCYLLNMGDFYKLAILFEISVAVWFCFFFLVMLLFPKCFVELSANVNFIRRDKLRTDSIR